MLQSNTARINLLLLLLFISVVVNKSYKITSKYYFIHIYGFSRDRTGVLLPTCLTPYQLSHATIIRLTFGNDAVLYDIVVRVDGLDSDSFAAIQRENSGPREKRRVVVYVENCHYYFGSCLKWATSVLGRRVYRTRVVLFCVFVRVLTFFNIIIYYGGTIERDK